MGTQRFRLHAWLAEGPRFSLWLIQLKGWKKVEPGVPLAVQGGRTGLNRPRVWFSGTVWYVPICTTLIVCYSFVLLCSAFLLGCVYAFIIGTDWSSHSALIVVVNVWRIRENIQCYLAETVFFFTVIGNTKEANNLFRKEEWKERKICTCHSF